MSMIARFVQVTPEVLKQYVEDASEIGELFDEGEGPAGRVAAVFPAATSNMGERLRRAAGQRGPQMLEALLERLDPAMREKLTEGLAARGYDVKSAGTAKGAEDLTKLMESRLAAMTAQISGLGTGGGASGAKVSGSISLEKAWHGVHYLLCGDAEPGASMASRAVMGGTELGDDDNGYGPARYFDVNEVVQMATELGRVELEKEMRGRFNPAAMTRAGIYPSSSWAAPDRDWLMGEFRRLRDFYAAAAAAGNAVVTCIV